MFLKFIYKNYNKTIHIIHKWNFHLTNLSTRIPKLKAVMVLAIYAKVIFFLIMLGFYPSIIVSCVGICFQKGKPWSLHEFIIPNSFWPS